MLFVCTGNVCRSPAAELMTRAWASPDADLRVGSAGIRALTGEGVDPPTIHALAKLGVPVAHHRAQQFEAFHAADADLVLVAEYEHRDAVMTRYPQARGRTFMLREFARLGRYLAPGRPTEVVAMAAAIRGVHTLDPRDDDLPDPYRRDAARAEHIVQLAANAVRSTLSVLGFAGDDLDRPADSTRRNASEPPQPKPVASRPRPGPTIARPGR